MSIDDTRKVFLVWSNWKGGWQLQKTYYSYIYIIYAFVHSSTFCTIYLTSSLKCSLKVYWYPVLSHMTKHVLSFFFTRNLLGGGGC